MKSRRASVCIESGLDRVDRAVQLLEDEWRKHGDVHLESFWFEQNRTGAVGPVDSIGVLAELVKADLRRRFDAGQRPTAAEYLERFPELGGADGRVLSLVYEEFCLCEERDGDADVESFCERYPDWKSSLASQLECHRMISQAAGATAVLPKFPKSGENFEEFQLLSRLGKGGTSRVFLARDLSLGGKHVALKVTLDRGQEPKIQGPLEHPHIVPVNSVTYQTGGRLCGLSMPYQPGLPLDEIIKRVKPSGRPARALALWSVLGGGPGGVVSPGSEVIPAGDLQAWPRGDGWKGFPERGTYTQGVAWIVMILARALHYAHGKRVFHRDVKPANVLLTINHGPQLLDFNLAESPHSADYAEAALRGGTLPYMAPEQIEAFVNPQLWAGVGAGADIYSLGLVLRELLTGQMPDLPKKGLPAARAMRDLLDRRPFLDVAVRRFNPAIPPSLEAIVAKCLALCPRDRYADAESLGQDLERFLNHQPLLQAGNPSRRERMGNCWMRQRRMLRRASLIGAGTLIFGAALARPVYEWTRASEQSQRDFQNSVFSLEKGDSKGTAEPLSRIVEAFPRSCLARFYLAFAHRSDSKTSSKADECVRKADDCLRQALAIPDAETTIRAWAEQHSEFCPLLVDFAEARIIRADEFAQRYDVDDPRADDEQRDTELRKPGYDLAQRALLLAEQLDPTSLRIQRLLATTEGLLGHYASSYRRFTHVIDTGPRETDSDLSTLFFCRKLRGRLAFLWVESERIQGTASDSGTLRFLQDARAELNVCNRYLSGFRFDVDPNLKEYAVCHDQARATLTLAEVETELGLATEATKHIGESQTKINELEGLRAGGLKVPKPTSLKKRLEKLRSPSGIASSRSSEQVPTRASQAVTHPG